jgi:hypothetical protein
VIFRLQVPVIEMRTMTRPYNQIIVLLLAAVFVAACAPTPTLTPPPLTLVPPATPTSPPPATAPSTETSLTKTDSMKIRLKLEDKVITATLINGKTTRDFISLLPLTLTMNDLFRREKYAHLPRAISNEGKRTHTYEVGNIAYWSPGPDVAIFYRNDGQEIPDPGIIVIGKIDSGVEALNVAGSVQVRIELVE